jgi:hypothetical protein
MMAKNTGEGYRRGEVRDRFQTYNPVTDQWAKHDAETGKIMDVKQDGTPFKGVRKDLGEEE